MTHLHSRSRQFVAGAAVALAAFGTTLTGCAAATVGSYEESRIEFMRYSTFGWGPDDLTPTGDPRLDNNPFFNERIRAAIARELAARGFDLVPSETSDLLVHIHASVTQEIDVGFLDQPYGFCAEGDCEPYVYDAGTVVVDLVDRVTNTLVWRGWEENILGDVIDNQAAMERRIDESVGRILARLPSRLSGMGEVVRPVPLRNARVF